MRIPIDRDSPTPLYKQVFAYLRQQIRSAALPPETRLPSSRDLAISLGVSRLTITNAYDELEALGFIYTVRGCGSFVSPLPVSQMDEFEETPQALAPSWQNDLLQNSWRSSSIDLDRLLAGVTRQGIISFASGSGDASLFPLLDFRAALQKVLREHGKDALAYGDPAGYPPLRATIARILSNQGIPARPQHILVTSGAQQAADLTVRLLVPPGSTVLAESPTHMGFLDLARSLNLNVIEVPVDDQGMQVDLVPQLLQTCRPRLIYTVPNFQNPSGACLSALRRRRLLALCEEHQLPILEDDYVGDLRYRGIAQPALKALDRTGAVIYAGTFSKMLIPSLRIGYLLASGPVLEGLLDLKHTTDIATSSLLQRALEKYISVGRYQACLRQARRIFGRRRDGMLAALARHMPPGMKWKTPQGGMFIWLQLPHGLIADELFPQAVDAGVVFAPGSFFFPAREPCSFMRLNFACQPLDSIEEGIRRLAEVVTRSLS